LRSQLLGKFENTFSKSIAELNDNYAVKKQKMEINLN